MKNSPLNYTFTNNQLKVQALTHRSASPIHNERLEYLGDALIGLIVAEYLCQRFPEADEGQLTRLRASVVNSDALYLIGKKISIGDMLILGEGEKKTGGENRVSTASDALEALIGAIYLDSDFVTCKKVVEELFCEAFASLDLSDTLKDPKTTLQELLQGKGLGLPHYRLENLNGPPHDRYFEISCSVKGLLSESVVGGGETRRKGEQAAAKKALSLILGAQEHE